MPNLLGVLPQKTGNEIIDRGLQNKTLLNHNANFLQNKTLLNHNANSLQNKNTGNNKVHFSNNNLWQSNSHLSLMERFTKENKDTLQKRKFNTKTNDNFAQEENLIIEGLYDRSTGMPTFHKLDTNGIFKYLPPKVQNFIKHCIRVGKPVYFHFCLGGPKISNDIIDQKVLRQGVFTSTNGLYRVFGYPVFRALQLLDFQSFSCGVVFTTNVAPDLSVLKYVGEAKFPADLDKEMDLEEIFTFDLKNPEKEA